MHAPLLILVIKEIMSDGYNECDVLDHHIVLVLKF